jgi:hypothetical protein
MLLVAATFIAYAAFDESVRRQREDNIIAWRMASLRSVLHPGMARGEVEEVLRQHSLSTTLWNMSGTESYVLLERFPSGVWYCSYLDVSAQLQFTLSGVSVSAQDKMTSITEHRQLEQCL